MNLTKIEHPEWGDDIVRNKDGTIRNPFDMVTTNLVVFLAILTCFGVLLNSEIVLRIVYDSNLMRKPRYILQLSTTFSSMFTLFTNVVGIIHFIFWQDHHFCKFYMFIAGWSYCTFLFNFLLSLIDCFVAITLPFWHRKNVTPRLVIFSLIVLNLVLMLAMKWQFILGIAPLRCVVQISHTVTITKTLFHLVFLCAFFLSVDYILTWKKLPRSSRSIVIRTPNARRAQRESEEIEMVDLIQQPTALMSVHSSIESVRRMELKATRTFLLDFIPLFLLPLPGLIFLYFYFTICPLIYEMEVCNDLAWLISPYMGILFTIHAVVNPILSLCLNKNFAHKPSPLRLLLIHRSIRRHYRTPML